MPVMARAVGWSAVCGYGPRVLGMAGHVLDLHRGSVAGGGIGTWPLPVVALSRFDNACSGLTLADSSHACPSFVPLAELTGLADGNILGSGWADSVGALDGGSATRTRSPDMTVHIRLSFVHLTVMRLRPVRS
jgi:hypothetical protein